MDRERLRGNLDLLLLSVLSPGPAHGYAIISALRDRSGGRFAGGVHAVLGWAAQAVWPPAAGLRVPAEAEPGWPA